MRSRSSGFAKRAFSTAAEMPSAASSAAASSAGCTRVP